MTKIIISVLLFIVINACNQINIKGEGSVTKGDDTVSDVEISTSKIDALNNLAEDEEQKNNHTLLFTADGTNPIWNVRFYSNQLKLVIDNGKDSLLIDDVFENIKDKDYSYSKATTINGKSIALSIVFNDKPCMDPVSGKKEDRSIIIKLNNKSYMGCGHFIK